MGNEGVDTAASLFLYPATDTGGPTGLTAVWGGVAQLVRAEES